MAEQFTPVSDVTSDDKLWALLAYIFSPIVPIIVLLMEEKKNRPYIKAHNIQALIWGIAYIIIGTIIAVPTLGIGSCLYLVGEIFSIYWGIQAYNGKYVRIPVITDWVKKQGWA